MNRRVSGPRMVLSHHHRPLTTSGRVLKSAWRESALITWHKRAVSTYRTFIIMFYMMMYITLKSIKIVKTAPT